MKQREIKFRVWDKDSEKMVTPPEDGEYSWETHPENGIKILAQSTVWREQGGETEEVSVWRPIDCVLMQFTGLLDKNGKEIYEGDVINTSEEDKPMVVTWSKKFASFCIERDGWAFKHWFGESCDPDKSEVIGNIYQNPELL